MTKNFLHLSTLLALLLLPLSTWADAVSSGELFGTYQERNAEVFIRDGNLPTGVAKEHADVYAVSFGDELFVKVLYKGNNLWGDVVSSVQVWNGESVLRTLEFLPSSSNAKMFYSTNEKAHDAIRNAGESFALTFRPKAWLPNNESSDLTTEKKAFTRLMINNPIADDVPPTLDVANTTFTDNGDGTITVAFGSVTADDEYFYYVADKAHNLGAISLTNTITITKPTIQDGTKYTFRAYAVDFNGNKSAYKEYVLQMLFDENVNLAAGKTTYAVKNGESGKDAVVDGNYGTRWSSSGAVHYPNANPEDWWYVDLGNKYSIKTIKIWFETACPTDYDILGSNDASAWTILGTYTTSPKTGTSAEQVNVYDFSASSHSARYIKIFARAGYSNLAYGFSMYEFEVYGSGLASSDAVAPVISTFSVKSMSINSATFHVVASDVDDEGAANSLTYSLTGDNGFVTTPVELDGSGDFTVSGLNYNAVYQFVLTASDPSGNQASRRAEVVLPFNSTINLALNRPAKCGYVQNGNAEWSAAKAVDGNEGTTWSSFGVSNEVNDWIVISLDNLYKLSKVVVKWSNDYATGYQLLGSANGTDWVELATDGATAAGQVKETAIPEDAISVRYVKLQPQTVTSYAGGVNIKEIEIYGSSIDRCADCFSVHF